jgi:hypothetical protein
MPNRRLLSQVHGDGFDHGPAQPADDDQVVVLQVGGEIIDSVQAGDVDASGLQRVNQTPLTR